MNTNRNLTIGLICPPSVSFRSELYIPTNLMILSAALKEAGFGVKVLDLNLLAAQKDASFYDDPLNFSLQAIEERASQPDLFGITTLCATYPFVLKLASALKEKYSVPVILGGPQASMTAERTMKLFPFIDFIVAHEGERTLVELMKTLAKGEDSSTVPGILFRKDGVVHTTPFRPFISNLDDSPFPDFAAVDIPSYQKIYSHVRVPVDVGRGCPFKCTFCSTAMMWKRSFRMKSPQRAIAEMDTLNRQFGVTHFFLTQDNLTTNRSYVYQLCELLKDRKYRWDCYSRCDTLEEDLLKAMVAAGCNQVFFGIESTSEKCQRLIGKNLKLDKIDRAVNACIRQKVNFITSYIIGFPEENRDDLEATLRSCFRDAARNPREVKLNVLAPIPGTELAERYASRFTAPLAFQPDASPFLLRGELAEEAKKLIAAYPDVFSSFYFIEPTHFSLNELFDIRSFYGLLISEFPRTTHLVLRHSGIPIFTLIDIYREQGLPLRAQAMTPEVMADYFAIILERMTDRLQPQLALIQELLRYELAIYQVRVTPTPEGLYQSQRQAARLNGQKIEPACLSFSPSLVSRSFQVDIDETLEALAIEDHQYQLLDSPRQFLFYEDAVNSDIVIEEIDPTVHQLLSRFEAGQFREAPATRDQLVNLIEKGVLIYRSTPWLN